MNICRQRMEGSNMSNNKNIRFRVRMLSFVRMRVRNHYPVHIVHMGKHRYAYLIGHEQ